jgi:hypothetical protein
MVVSDIVLFFCSSPFLHLYLKGTVKLTLDTAYFTSFHKDQKIIHNKSWLYTGRCGAAFLFFLSFFNIF